MNKLIFILFVLILPISAKAATGFASGNSFTATPIEGEIHVTCNDSFTGGITTGNFVCENEILEPVDYDFFMGPKNTGADEVSLVAHHADNTNKESSEDFDSETGMSKSFNLWVSSLFQHPLLKVGTNLIDYYLKRSDAVISQGSFTVEVSEAPLRTCRNRGYFYSNDRNDCMFTNYGLCSMYFRQENYCR